MQGTHLLTLTSKSYEIASSLYQEPIGNLAVWLKVGAAMLQMTEENIDEAIEILQEMKTAMAIINEEED